MNKVESGKGEERMQRHPCKICKAQCGFLAIVDLAKACLEPNLRSGINIAYRRCVQCGFIFAPEMHAWSPREFKRNIYNDEYLRFDPEHERIRPQQSAKHLFDMFNTGSRPGSHLDYGGGRGVLSESLHEWGWESKSCDLFFGDTKAMALAGCYDLITAFEVFEHVVDIHAMMFDFSRLLGNDGVVYVQTALCDSIDTPGELASWWYAAPRNGHISFFTQKAFRILAAEHGFDLWHGADGMLFVRGAPEWLGAFRSEGFKEIFRTKTNNNKEKELKT